MIDMSINMASKWKEKLERKVQEKYFVRAASSVSNTS